MLEPTRGVLHMAEAMLQEGLTQSDVVRRTRGRIGCAMVSAYLTLRQRPRIHTAVVLRDALGTPPELWGEPLTGRELSRWERVTDALYDRGIVRSGRAA